MGRLSEYDDIEKAIITGKDFVPAVDAEKLPGGYIDHVEARQASVKAASGEKSEAEHLSLIETANKGFKAIDKLTEKYADQTEFVRRDSQIKRMVPEEEHLTDYKVRAKP